MLRVASAFKSIALIGLYFGVISVLDANCDTPNTGCPPYSQMVGSFPKNSNVQIQVANGDAATIAAVSSAIASLNNDAATNGTGTTFTLVTTINQSQPYAIINMDTTTTNPVNGNNNELIGHVDAYGSGPTNNVTFTHADVTIYLAGQDAGSANFDSTKPGYQAAVSVATQHELYHTLGIGDAHGGRTLMSPWVGTNDSMIDTGQPVVNGPQPCDDKQSNAVQAAKQTGSMCPAGT